MNKLVPVLSVVLAGSVLTAVMYARDSQRERLRADALAQRLFELEPVERSASVSAGTRAEVESAAPLTTKPPVQPSALDLPVSDALSEPKSVMDYPGSLRARKQVESLQTALTHGTPLQEYQIQALINAIDDVHREAERDSKLAHVAQGDRKLDERVLQVAADILFESQLEVFIALLQGQSQEMSARGSR